MQTASQSSSRRSEDVGSGQPDGQPLKRVCGFLFECRERILTAAAQYQQRCPAIVPSLAPCHPNPPSSASVRSVPVYLPDRLLSYKSVRRILQSRWHVRALALLATLAIAVLVSACGSSGTPSPSAGIIAKARSGLLARWPAIGRPTIVRTSCKAHGCTLTYDYTPPDGYRREYLATVPTTSAHASTLHWPGFKVRRILRRFGLDPSYPVGQCIHAIDHALSGPNLVNLKTDHTVELACNGVHHSVYTGPLLTPPGH